MEFRQFTGDRHRSRRAKTGREIRHRSRETMGGFVKNEGAGFGSEGGEAIAPRLGLTGQKSLKHKRDDS